MRKFFLGIALALTLVFTSSSAVFAAEIDTEYTPEEGVYFVNEVCDLINEQRVAAGLSELVWSDELAEASVTRCAEQRVAFSHTRPDGTDWYTADENLLYGEILAKGYSSVEEVIEAWMASELHRSVILSESFNTLCAVCYVTETGTTYWVVEFGL